MQYNDYYISFPFCATQVGGEVGLLISNGLFYDEEWVMVTTFKGVCVRFSLTKASI